jgi:hypothetical protein
VDVAGYRLVIRFDAFSSREPVPASLEALWNARLEA